MDQLINELAKGWNKDSIKQMLDKLNIDKDDPKAKEKIRAELKKRGVDEKYLDGLSFEMSAKASKIKEPVKESFENKLSKLFFNEDKTLEEQSLILVKTSTKLMEDSKKLMEETDAMLLEWETYRPFSDVPRAQKLDKSYHEDKLLNHQTMAKAHEDQHEEAMRLAKEADRKAEEYKDVPRGARHVMLAKKQRALAAEHLATAQQHHEKAAVTKEVLKRKHPSVLRRIGSDIKSVFSSGYRDEQKRKKEAEKAEFERKVSRAMKGESEPAAPRARPRPAPAPRPRPAPAPRPRPAPAPRPPRRP